jgi:hypothetical protein
MTTKDSDKEPFLSRWSRLKEKAREEPQKTPEEAETAEKTEDSKAPLPELPSVEQLTPDSDYRPFLDPRVDEDTRRVALKKLFADARFNVIDPMDVYIDDYTKADPIPAAMLASLKQAQNILEWAKRDQEERKDHPDRTEAGNAGEAGTDADPVASLPEPEPDPGALHPAGDPDPVPRAGDDGAEKKT